MYKEKCKICGTTNNLFSLVIEADDADVDEPFIVWVCGSCWKIIAAISKRVTRPMIEKSEIGMMHRIGSYISLE